MFMSLGATSAESQAASNTKIVFDASEWPILTCESIFESMSALYEFILARFLMACFYPIFYEKIIISIRIHMGNF